MNLKTYSADNVKDNDILFASWDVETEGLGGELLFITAHIFGNTYEFKGPGMMGRFIELAIEFSNPVIWYAHFADYDFRYLVPELIELGYDVKLGMRTDTDIYQVTVKGPNGKIIFRDSYAMFPGTLADLAKSFCPEIPKLQIDIENFNPDDATHREYARRDVEILALALPRFDSMMRRHFDVGLGHTTAGTAVKAWELTLGFEYFKASIYNERELFIRQGYYGGLVFLTTTEHLKSTDGNPVCETFDVNSSYPSVMCDYGVPSGRCISTRDYKSGLMGIYRVRVKAPENLIVPILPSRNERGHMQWRRGTFETVCTSSELIFAANHGYKILEVFEGIAWESVAFPFNEFIEKCKTIRREFKGKPEELLAKLMQNSLYGKFGTRRDRLKIFHPETDADMIGAEPLENLEYFWMKKETDETMRCLPEWAVFITAHARLKILHAVYSVGVENALYGDTDSITVRAGKSDSIDVGLEYGQFKREKGWLEFRAIAPKVYAGITENGRRKGAAKGLPKKAMIESKWAELLETGETTAGVMSLASLRVALQKGVAPAKQLERKSSSLNNSQNWELINNQVRPKLAS